MDKALFSWILDCRKKNARINSDTITQHSLYFYKKLYGDDNFNGSKGYFEKFKTRHNLRRLKICGEKLSCDDQGIEKFGIEFSEFVQKNGLLQEQIFNADESAIYIRKLPDYTYVTACEKEAPGASTRAKERFTFMPCINMSGDFKLPLLFIGRSRQPRVLRQLDYLPVTYTHSANAWMTKIIFVNWFHSIFVPQVTEYLLQKAITKKAVLLLDNCSAHNCLDQLKSHDGNITAFFLPPNTTSKLQPCDQNMIACIKSNYKKILKNKIIDEHGDFYENLNKIDLKDAIFMISEAWDKVDEKTIQCSWNKVKSLLPEFEATDVEYLDESFWEDPEENEIEPISKDEIIDQVLAEDQYIENPNYFNNWKADRVFGVNESLDIEFVEVPRTSTCLEIESGACFTHTDQEASKAMDILETWGTEKGISSKYIENIRQMKAILL